MMLANFGGLAYTKNYGVKQYYLNLLLKSEVFVFNCI